MVEGNRAAIGRKGRSLRLFSLAAILALASLDFEAAAGEIRHPGRSQNSLAPEEFGSLSRTEYLRGLLGINGGQAERWSDYVSALETYRKAVSDQREQEVQRVLGGVQAMSDNPDTTFNELRSRREAAKASLRTKFETLFAALDSSQQQIAKATLTAGECGK